MHDGDDQLHDEYYLRQRFDFKVNSYWNSPAAKHKTYHYQPLDI